MQDNYMEWMEIIRQITGIIQSPLKEKRGRSETQIKECEYK